jgi:hypothetical protein
MASDPDLRLRASAAAARSRFSSLVAAGARDATDKAVEKLSPEEIKVLRLERVARAQERKERFRYTAKTQPRDSRGKFRRVLARLKSDLGTAGLDRVVDKVEQVERLGVAGDYKASADAADQLRSMLDRLDTKALNPEALENVRNASEELGSVISNLPFAFGQEAQKIRFSDVPPALQELMRDMVDRVYDKLEEPDQADKDEDADTAVADLKRFMSGGDYFNQSEVSSNMSKLLRLLT